MNTLENTFLESLNREGKEILINGGTQKVFFRRNEKGETDPYITMYAPLESSIEQGNEFILDGSHYLIMKALTKENDVYQKFSCILADETIKWMYAKNDLVIYHSYMIDLNDSLSISKDGITNSGKCQIILPLNEDSKRITINGRFFCGAYCLAWKVTDLNYKNNLCYIYAERDTVLPTDDTTNGIVNRWQYEDKPSNYVVAISQDAISVEQNKTSQLTVSVTKDGTLLDPTPTINYTVANGSICSIDANNLVTGLTVGGTTIKGSYKVNEYDTCTSDSVSVTVTEPVVVADIVVSPTYNNSSYYGLEPEDTQTFTCSLNGVENAAWNITLSTSASSTHFTSTINNANGTFTVVRKDTDIISNSYLDYTITEQTTDKTATYRIKLLNYF